MTSFGNHYVNLSKAFALKVVLLWWQVPRTTSVNETGVQAGKVLRNIFPAGYNYVHPPKPGGGPAVVNASFSVSMIPAIREDKLELDLDFFLWVQWLDDRLSFPNESSLSTLIDGNHTELEVTNHTELEMTNHTELEETEDFIWLSPDEQKAIWWPHLYFPAAKQGMKHDLWMPNSYAKFYKKNNRVQTSARYTITIFCMFDFRMFPFDVQKCNVDFESYRYHTKELVLQFSGTKDGIPGKDGFKIDVNMKELAAFSIVKTETKDCSYTWSMGAWEAVYPCIRGEVYLSRETSYYISHFYLPSIILHIASWMGFWIRVDAVPGRVVLGITSLLAIASQDMAAQKALPPVSYLKALDIWMTFSLTLIFLTVVEFVAAYNYEAYRDLPQNRSKFVKVVPTPDERTSTAQTTASVKTHSNVNTSTNNTKMDVANQRSTSVSSLTSAGQQEDHLIDYKDTLGLRKETPPKGGFVSHIFRLFEFNASTNPLDKYASIIWPCVFGIFNVFYWTWIFYMDGKKIRK